jgi:NitT/TauT family transport system substrate-binding protein
VDVAATDYFSLLNVADQGQPVREFVLLQKLPGFAAVVSPKASRPIRNLQDLKGRTVGVNSRGNGFHRLLVHILQAHGVDPDQVSVVGVGTGMSVAMSLERGAVDVGLTNNLTTSYLKRRFPSLEFLFDTRTAESTKAVLGTDEIASTIVCAREDWLKTHAEAARRLASAMQCALTWTHSHSPQQIREALPESICSPDAESDFDAIAITKSQLSLDGRMTAEAHAAAVRFLTTTDSAKLKIHEPYTNEFLRP